MCIRDSPVPWYKYKLVWMVIAIPAASVVAGINMIYLAVNTDDGLVVDDYYKEGMAINQSLQRDRNAAELGLAAQLMVEDSGNMIRLNFNKGSLTEYPGQLTLHLQHTIREGVWHITLSTEEWRLVNRVHWQNGLNINLVSQE